MSTLTKNKQLIFEPVNLSEAPRFGKSRGKVLQPSFTGLMSAIALFRARSTQRRELRLLTPQQLKDMGITAEEVMQESAKWFWQQ